MKGRKGELMDKLSIKRFFAFTLAETLIVMGIIGVVAALTIPNLNSSTADKEKVAKLKKVYSNLEDAVGRSEAVYGPMSDWGMGSPNGNDDATKVAERLGDFLKVSKTCGLTANSACLSTSLKDLSGNTSVLTYRDIDPASGNSNFTYKYILADGTGLGIKAASGKIALTVDLDGPNKGASTLGKDIFTFFISEDGVLGDGRSWTLLTDPTVNGLTSVADLTSNFKTGTYLATWVIQNDNMDYLKATEGKCKNNTSRVLSWTNTSCK